MLNDGKDFLLFCFKQNTNNTLYQFNFDGSSYAHNSGSEITLSYLPEHADTNVFAMLNDGDVSRLYLGDKNPDESFRYTVRNLKNDRQWYPGDASSILYQYVWDGETFQLESDSPDIGVIGLSDSANLNTIAMLHTGEEYVYYALDHNKESVCQAAFTGGVYAGRNVLNIKNIPQRTNTNTFSMAYGDKTYQLYFLEDE